MQQNEPVCLSEKFFSENRAVFRLNGLLNRYKAGWKNGVMGERYQNFSVLTYKLKAFKQVF